MTQIFTKSLCAAVYLPLLFSTGKLLAQTQGSNIQNPQDYKNQVKWNVPALFLKNFTVQYERAIARKITAGATVRFSGKSDLPLQNTLESLIDNKQSFDRIKDFQMSNFAITPEVRFYMSEQAFKGFYLAPFVSYANYKASGPYRFESSQGSLDMPLEGNIRTIGAGFYMGAQFNVAKRVGLDLFIGPNYGKLKGTISGKRTLNNDEQNGLRSGLNDLKEIPMIDSKYTVDGNGASVDLDGTWPGLRAGLSVAFRF